MPAPMPHARPCAACPPLCRMPAPMPSPASPRPPVRVACPSPADCCVLTTAVTTPMPPDEPLARSHGADIPTRSRRLTSLPHIAPRGRWRAPSPGCSSWRRSGRRRWRKSPSRHNGATSSKRRAARGAAVVGPDIAHHLYTPPGVRVWARHEGGRASGLVAPPARTAALHRHAAARRNVAGTSRTCSTA